MTYSHCTGTEMRKEVVHRRGMWSTLHIAVEGIVLRMRKSCCNIPSRTGHSGKMGVQPISHWSGPVPSAILGHSVMCTVLHNILEPIAPIPIPVQCEWVESPYCLSQRIKSIYTLTSKLNGFFVLFDIKIYLRVLQKDYIIGFTNTLIFSYSFSSSA